MLAATSATLLISCVGTRLKKKGGRVKKKAEEYYNLVYVICFIMPVAGKGSCTWNLTLATRLLILL